jgi:ACS family hexuronate transporter-like MFS transporter
VGIALGSAGAVWLVGRFAGWRSAFFVCALLGFGWIPLWILVRRTVKPWQAVAPQKRTGGWKLLSDPRLIRLALANSLWMVGYVLWSGWTTKYFVGAFGMSQEQANAFAWFPPVASTFGAFAGGWISQRAIRGGASDVSARLVALRTGGLGCLVALLVPFCRTPLLAALAIGASYFWTLAGSVNLYTIPVDIWGGERAGTAISALVFSYGLLSVVLSPAIGSLADRFGFRPVCWLVAFPPLLAWMMLRRIDRGVIR